VAPPATVTNFLDLEFDTAMAGSLADYTGGPLLSGIVFLKGPLMVDASLTSGSLTRSQASAASAADGGPRRP
jgi:hypothetical protein